MLSSLKIKNSICLAFLLIWQVNFLAQNKQELYQKAIESRQAGDLNKSKVLLNQMLQMKDSITERNKVAIYNLFGMIYDDAGSYDSAITYYKMSIDLFIKKFGEDFSVLSTIYSNIAVSYKMTGDNEKALGYYNTALYKVDSSSLTISEKYFEKARIYLNIGVVYVQMEEYAKAIDVLQKSLDIKLKFKFDRKENVYFNLARSYEKTGDNKKAEIYYLKCIDAWENGVVINISFLPAAAYKYYAALLVKMNKPKLALDYYNKSLNAYLKYYGERHPYPSDNYLALANHFTQLKDWEKALENYQNAIVANTRKFNKTSIYELPDKSDVISEQQMIKNLMKKSEALLEYAEIIKDKKKKSRILNVCIKSSELAISLIYDLKRAYLTKGSKLNIIRDEKQFNFLAAKASIKLFEFIKHPSDINQAFAFVQKSKASLLNEEILNHKAFTTIFPDSVKQKINKSEIEIYSLKKLIFDENQQARPDEKKIQALSARLFNLNSIHEMYIENLKKRYPEYGTMTKKSNIIDIKELQKNLKNGQSIVEYALSQKSEKEGRELLIFILTNKSMNYHHSIIKNDLAGQVQSYLTKITQQQGTRDIIQYNEINKLQFEFYNLFIKPVEKYIPGKEIFIVPDEEMAFLSFDSFQKSYHYENAINFAGIPYLIYDYCFSYGYSSGLLFPDEIKTRSNYVYAFAPEYTSESAENSRLKLGKLEYTEKEIEAIFKWFKGKALIGRKANEDFFKQVSGEAGIFHFALHALAEKSNPDFSFLAVNASDSARDDGYFYNYEIAMINMKASMVVLSGCNTGDGIISSGEGILSLSRNFTLAGAGSIVHSLWEIQDETGVIIMDKFYENLSKGMPKNIALHEAKLFYINNASPTMVNPYYWAGYIQSGDPGTVKSNNTWLYIVLSLIIALIGVIFIYLRKTKRLQFRK